MPTPPPIAESRGLASFPVHPLLLAVFPVLFLFAENTVQQVTLDPLWLPLGAAAAGALVLLALAAALTGDVRRGALAASVVIVLFFSFGHVWNVASESTNLPDRGYLAAVYGVLAIAGVGLAWRAGPWLMPVTRLLNVVAIVLVAFNVVRIGEFALGTGRIGVETARAAAVPVGEIERKPDIYYVVLDRYSNSRTLDEIYGYDNEPFLRELEERGFTVARQSWANYFKTAFSLVSSLSMDYLDGPALKARGNSFEQLHTALRNRLAVPSTLKSLGYEYVHIANHWEPSAENVDADRVLRFANGSEFSSALLATTAWGLTQPIPEPTDLTQVEIDMTEMGYREMTRAHTLYEFDRLNEVIDRPGPTYTFAHILVPHTPWRFNDDGSFPTVAELNGRTNRESYLHQLRYANARVLAWLDRLLDVPEDEKPIVILQADEGEFPERFAADQVDFNWLEATPEEIQHKYGILNAFHLPGVDDEAVGVHDRISPVNEFRIVFNAYFGTNLPLLPERHFLTPSYHRLYDFVEVEQP